MSDTSRKSAPEARVRAPGRKSATGGHVFLSYRSIEREFALRLAAALRNAGVRLWVDCLPEGIRGGDDWPRTLEAALDTCTSLIAILSPDYSASNVCRQELQRVAKRGKVLFTVLLRPLGPTERPLEVERIQDIDFTAASDPGAFELKVRDLVERLRDGAAVIGQGPDPEQQYLLRLVADLEGRGGVTQYVELEAALSRRPGDEASHIPKLASAWGLDAEFSLLEGGAAQPGAGAGAPPQPINDIVDLVRNPHVFALLGDPGAGKTTTLRRLALEMARARLDDPQAPLPLLLSLPQWRNEPDPVSFIATHCPFVADPADAIAAGDVALFLDGLNEMGRDSPARHAALRQWLASSARPRRLAVTCRTQDYAELDLKTDCVTVAPLDAARVTQFVECYLGENAPPLLEKILPRSEFPDSRSLFAIARNPYLLQCLTLLHGTDAAGQLPRNLGKLFGRLMPYLWKRELQRQTAGWLPFDEGSRKLAALAFAMIEDGRATSVPIEYARAKVDVELIRFAERASVLALDGGSVGFHHQLIQEYFAAVAIADQPLERERIRSATWREVIVALAGIKDDPDQVVDVIRDADHRLAARCLIEGVAAEDATVGRVANDLIRELGPLAARAEEKRAEDVRYRQQNPGMSWSSTQMMEDALDHHFGHPEVEMAEILQLLKNLGPQAHASIALAAVADGPAGPDLRAIVREPAGRR